MSTTTTNTQNHHIVIIPSPGMGHLIPLVEFAKLLHFNHHFSITLLLPSSSPPTPAQTTFLSTLPPAISHTFLPPVDPTSLPSNVAHEVILQHVHSHSLAFVRDALTSLSSTDHNIVAVIADLFGTDYFDVAREVGIAPYMYFTTTAFCCLFMLNINRLHETVSCEYRDMKDHLVLPGCVPLHGKDFVDPAQDRTDQAYKILLYQTKRYTLADGIFVNSFMDLEPGAFNALKTEDLNWPEIYPIGPVIQSGLGQDSKEGLECLRWLDRQKPGSVLFVSFGSGGTLSNKQINELAIGLEKSGERFLWVVRAPSDSAFGSFFTQGDNNSKSKPFGFLPEGYVDRVKDSGLLVSSWAPQIEVLSHESTGGFLSHCGWNSTLESIVYGVPLIAWPLYAEQRMNAVMLNEGLKVALRPKASESGVVEGDEIARIVKDLMGGAEGKGARERMTELSELARKARSEEGDSTKNLRQVAQKWSQK